MKGITAEWIVEAVKIIKSGMAQKLEKDGVIVYSCGKIVRIDIKADTVVASRKDFLPDDGPNTEDCNQFPACADDAEDLPWY